MNRTPDYVAILFYVILAPISFVDIDIFSLLTALLVT
jgi:hypothetical protein